MTTTRLILKLSNVITTTTIIFLHQSHKQREAAYRVASLGDRIDDITGLYIKVSDYLQHHKLGYLYIYRCAKWIAKL
jgi:hypothetical protein